MSMNIYEWQNWMKLFILEHSKHFSNFETSFASFEVLNNIHESTFFSKAFPEVASKHSKRARKTILELKTEMKEVYDGTNSSQIVR